MWGAPGYEVATHVLIGGAHVEWAGVVHVEHLIMHGLVRFLI